MSINVRVCRCSNDPGMRTISDRMPSRSDGDFVANHDSTEMLCLGTRPAEEPPRAVLSDFSMRPSSARPLAAPQDSTWEGSAQNGFTERMMHEPAFSEAVSPSRSRGSNSVDWTSVTRRQQARPLRVSATPTGLRGAENRDRTNSSSPERLPGPWGGNGLRRAPSRGCRRRDSKG